MAEYDMDFCVPSAMLIAHMLKFALVWEGYASAGLSNPTTVWLMRMAPRRWFQAPPNAAEGDGAAAVAVRNARTKLGLLTFTIATPTAAPQSVDRVVNAAAAFENGAENENVIEAHADAGSTSAALNVRVALTISLVRPGIVKIRLRDPSAGRHTRQLASVKADGRGGAGPFCEGATLTVDHANQTVDVAVDGSVGRLFNCSFVATLK